MRRIHKTFFTALNSAISKSVINVVPGKKDDLDSVRNSENALSYVSCNFLISKKKKKKNHYFAITVG